jgi:hypothetical protein
LGLRFGNYRSSDKHTLLGLIGVSAVGNNSTGDRLKMSTCQNADIEPYAQLRHDTNGNSVTHGRLPREGAKRGGVRSYGDNYVYPVGVFLIGWCIQIRET